ncbi:MAG: hypothetical protein ABSD98_00610 [Candidatus Korobacteraceae bacterium]|jgi:hypothetical protein
MEISIHSGDLRPALATCKTLSNAVGTINPRPPGLHNHLIQLVKQGLARLLAGYTRSQREFNLSVVRSLHILASSIEKLRTNVQAMDGRLPQLERENTELTSTLQKCLEILVKLESLANSQKNAGPETALSGIERQAPSPQAAPSVGPCDCAELRSAAAAIEKCRNALATSNPRPSAWHDSLVQFIQKPLARLLAWYARPQREFNLSAVRCLDILASSMQNLQINLQAIDGRLPQLERDNAALTSSLQECLELFAKLESLATPQKNIDLETALETALASMEGPASNSQPSPSVKLYDFDEPHSAVAATEKPSNATTASLWPWRDFNASIGQSLKEVVRAVGKLSTVIVTLDCRLAQAEKRSATLAEAIQEQLSLLHGLVKAIVSLQKTAILEVPASRMETDWDKQAREVSQFYIDTGLGNDRTTYLIGLFGTGRLYVNGLMLQNSGERAKYFRDGIRLHRGPTSMIYSGHATRRYVSRGQFLPAVMSCILEAVRLGFADLIFLCRHPLDSLLTNWIWWRTYIHAHKGIGGISEIYKNTDNLCADLEQNFSEFKAFAEGDPDFFAAEPGTRFLSFQEFVEETALHLQSATLTLRLEDFMVDPLKEFSKIVELMSVDFNSIRLPIVPPHTKPYRYLAIKDKVPRFRNFIDGLDAETKGRIQKIGYSLD